MVKVKYTYCCSACDEQWWEEQHIRLGGVIPKPNVPHGWSVVNNSIYCPKHYVMVQNKNISQTRNEGIDDDV